LGFYSRDLAIAHGGEVVSAALRGIARLEKGFSAMKITPRLSRTLNSKGEDGDVVGKRCRLRVYLIVLKVLVITHVCSSP
jgi:hypothetical protein